MKKDSPTTIGPASAALSNRRNGNIPTQHPNLVSGLSGIKKKKKLRRSEASAPHSEIMAPYRRDEPIRRISFANSVASTTSAAEEHDGQSTASAVDAARFVLELEEKTPLIIGADYQVQPQDVICGGGARQRARSHAGNMRLRVLLELRLSLLENEDKLGVVEKIGMVKEAVQAIKNGGGKFVKFSNEGWVDVGHVRAHQLVAEFLRRLLQERPEIKLNPAELQNGPRPPTTTRHRRLTRV